MKFEHAMGIINKSEIGFMVHFEILDGVLLKSDFFPDKYAGEKLIQSEVEAWELARRFAKATNENTVNIYVINDKFLPVTGYEEKTLKKK